MSPSAIRATLARLGLRPLKSLGQNFLTDPNLCRVIAEALPAPEGSPVLEVGPGLGALTRALLTRGFPVTAFEIDRGLANHLRQLFRDEPRFTLVEGDALRTLPAQPACEYLTGNLPYNISTPLVMETLLRPHPPRAMVFTLQKETARRFAAPHDTADYGAVTVLLQALYETEVLRNLPPDVFLPRPNVDSALFRATLRAEPLLAPAEGKPFYQWLRRAFSQRRKKLRNTLGVPDDRRPEHLSVPEWITLFRSSRTGDDLLSKNP
jgi:16S rRNA (adenine1518-N6/adenine1519-N6)-dimethyltransferase